jgi:putative peptidoglycan lipid II flippase
MAASALGYFALSLPFSGLIPVLAKAFYAKHDTKTPVIIAVSSIAISVILAYIFSYYQIGNFGGKVSGLAFAFSIGSFVNAIVLFAMLSKQGWIADIGKILFAVTKIAIAGLVMGAAIQLTKRFLGESVDMQRFWGVAVKAVVSMSFGIIAYLIMSYILKIEEIKHISIRQLLSSRVSKGTVNEYNNTSEQAQQ